MRDSSRLEVPGTSTCAPTGLLADAAAEGENIPIGSADANRSRPIRALVLRSVSGAGGGAEKIILRTGESCDPRRLRLTVCAIHDLRDRDYDFPERAGRAGVNVISIPQRRPFDPQVFRKIQSVASEGDFDVIHSHDYKSNFYALKLARATGLPTVSTAHGWTGALTRERCAYYPLDKRLLRRFDAIIGVSSEICNELRRRGVPERRLRTVLNGVDAEKYRRNDAVREGVRNDLSIGDNEIVLGAVGRVEKQKRFDLLLEAFASLAPQRAELRLMIVGDGSLLDSLRSQVKKLHLEDRCRLLGHRGDMLRLYQAFDMYVQSSEYEGTPTVLVEAMAMEIPIVATDVGGTTELVHHGDHALIVPPHDAESLARAIAATLDDSAGVERRLELARRRAENELSIGHRTAQLLRVYADVISARAES